jgi:hypothetical protein
VLRGVRIAGQSDSDDTMKVLYQKYIDFKWSNQAICIWLNIFSPESMQKKPPGIPMNISGGFDILLIRPVIYSPKRSGGPPGLPMGGPRNWPWR